MSVWTFSDTGAHIHATFVASVDCNVQVRRTDGKMVSLEIAKLTATDQKWIELKKVHIRQLNENAKLPTQFSKLVATLVESKPAIWRFM